MTQMSDIVNPRELAQMIAEGYVKVQMHPTLTLAIYNYTPKTQYERRWNATTRACRGLIMDVTSGEVVARPFPKFFNYGEDTSTLDTDAQVTVTDKADGSLGIVYPTPGIGSGWSVATRGSFTSEQAEWATKELWTTYGDWSPPEGVTVLFEIIYPENRIVLDYGGARELRLIDALWVDRGWPLGSDPLVVATAVGWPGPTVGHFGIMAMKRALELPPRPNAEGIVVRYLDTDTRIKIKQADYVELHRIVTGLNERVIWQHLADEKPLSELLEKLPDEFHDWCSDVADRLVTSVVQQRTAIKQLFNRIVSMNLVNRREFAAEAQKHDERWALFMLLDGRDITPELWKRARPAGRLTPFGTEITEDDA